MKRTEKDKAEALERLREWVKPGDTLYTVLRGVSSSGMTRYIDVIKFEYNETDKRLYKVYLSYNIALAGIFTYNENKNSLKISGCGMDMGFHVIYTLASILEYTRYHTKDKQDVAPNTNCYGLNHEWI